MAAPDRLQVLRWRRPLRFFGRTVDRFESCWRHHPCKVRRARARRQCRPWPDPLPAKPEFVWRSFGRPTRHPCVRAATADRSVDSLRQSRINAIGADHVSMGMEIQCRTEPLYERDRSALAAWNTALGCAFAHGLEDDAGKDSHHSGQQIGVIRHAVTQAVGDRQRPLPHRDLRQYAIH